jgi:molybdenum cofactor cytidylyltransferase
MPDNCAAVILAAGASSRLGQPKQLLQINGESLVRRTARFAAEAGCAPVGVVTGARAEEISAELHLSNIFAFFNANWPDGIGSSIRCGVVSLLQIDPSVSNIVLLVCDQVRLSAAVLQELRSINSAYSSEIVASQYAGTLGVPAIFPREFFPELQQLNGNQGARRVIKKYSHRVKAVAFDGGTVDVDTSADRVFFVS